MIKISYIDKLPRKTDMVIHANGGFIPKYVESVITDNYQSFDYVTTSLVSGEKSIIPEVYCLPVMVHACEPIEPSKLRKNDLLLNIVTNTVVIFDDYWDGNVTVRNNGFFEIHPINQFLKVADEIDWRKELSKYEKHTTEYLLTLSKINHHEKSRIQNDVPLD